MNKRFIIVFFLPLYLNAQYGVKFEENLMWKQVIQKAKEDNKYIFVDCYATWCGPCKYMDKSIYSLNNVSNFYNDNFICVKVQMDSAKADNDFVKRWYADANLLKTNYNVAFYPTYLFFSPDGDIVHRDVGVKNPDEFINVGKDALNSEKQYYALLEKYNKNELDVNAMKILALKVKEVEGGELARRIANDYLNRLPINDLFTPDNIRLMYEYTRSSNDKGFIIFKDSAKRINKTDGRVKEDVCKNIVLNIINNEEIKPYRFTKNGKPDWIKIKSNLKRYGALGDEAFLKYKPGIIFKTEIEPVLKVNSDWKNILLLIQKQNLGMDAEFVVGSTVVYYLNGINAYHSEKNCKNFVAAATYYADHFPTFLTSRTLNAWAWTIFEHSTDKGELNKALSWSKRSNDLEPNSPEILDTYANILYKLRKVDDAITWEEKAVQAESEQAKRFNRAVRPDYKDCLDKMKQGK